MVQQSCLSHSQKAKREREKQQRAKVPKHTLRHTPNNLRTPLLASFQQSHPSQQHCPRDPAFPTGLLHTQHLNQSRYVGTGSGNNDIPAAGGPTVLHSRFRPPQTSYPKATHRLLICLSRNILQLRTHDECCGQMLVDLPGSVFIRNKALEMVAFHMAEH